MRVKTRNNKKENLGRISRVFAFVDIFSISISQHIIVCCLYLICCKYSVSTVLTYSGIIRSVRTSYLGRLPVGVPWPVVELLSEVSFLV